MDPEKIKVIRGWPPPTTVHEVRQFIGLCGFYQQFVEGFQAVAAPLTAMFKAEFEWEWTAVHQAFFDKLKQAMINATHLSAIDPRQPYHLYTDASKDCVAATPAQRCAHGKYKGHLRPIAFMSRKMQPAETRYPIREQELLAIVLALKQWFHLLRGPQQVHVHTDHKSLRYLKKCPRPLTPRQARWSQFLEEYNLTLWYIPGLENPAADTCSRLNSQQLMDIENATRTWAFVVPLVENWASAEGEPVDEFLHVLEDSFSEDEVWPKPYDQLYASLRSGRSVGKETDADEHAESALQFNTEPAVEPEDLEPLPSNAITVEPKDLEPVPSDEILAEDSHQRDIHLHDAGNEPDIPADTDDLPDVSRDRPPRVTFNKELRYAPTMAELTCCRRQRDGTLESVHSVRAMLAEERRRQMHVVLQMDRHVRVPEVGERWWVLVPEYQHKGKLRVVWCGPYKVVEVLNKGEKVKLDIPAPLDGLRVFNRDSIKPYMHREGQPVWEFPMPPVKTGESPRLVKVLARRMVSKKRCTFLYHCEWDDDTWSWESSKALEEDPVYLEFLRLHPE